MYGGSLKPEPSYLPISSTLSASFGFSVGAPSDGGAWSSAGMTCVSSSALAGLVFSGTVVIVVSLGDQTRGATLRRPSRRIVIAASATWTA
jgi:hypothetical protein